MLISNEAQRSEKSAVEAKGHTTEKEGLQSLPISILTYWAFMKKRIPITKTTSRMTHIFV
ncbi:hypothetical protein D3H65_19800 [Paraflavitalea soli]|uniref:Uncharacterized protein n=1 Tax=Paraflavitalea soli TaxID=2315862 RepID=A0A3B7MSQ6_9BACT|nr:hypothetical protein D3H65_19800 [Paraflavitalea soli]